MLTKLHYPGHSGLLGFPRPFFRSSAGALWLPRVPADTGPIHKGNATPGGASFNAGRPSRAVAQSRKEEPPAARPLASGEPATVARLLVGTFPPKEATQRARTMLADLQRLLPRHDWERHLRSAMRSELGLEPADWMAPKPVPAAKAAPPGAAKRPKVTLRVPKDPPKPAPRVGPSKSVAHLSQDLERILAEAQKAQAAPPGKEKCPLCGAILDPMRGNRVRTHDDPVKGARCAASQRPRGDYGPA